jgi:hypothetical protein
MYPYHVWISKPNSRYDMYKVTILDYPMAISVGAFKRRILTAGSKLSKELENLEVYSCLPGLQESYQMEQEIKIHEERDSKYCFPFIYTLKEKEYELLGFYKEIGYDKSTGKINGRTLRQHIKHYTRGKV